MPTYQIIEILTRIGLALAAGVIIAIVPITWRKARFASRQSSRVFLYILMAIALVGFLIYGWFLWNHFLPHESEAPPPVEYPVTPVLPAVP